jgi:hypothetical protein
MAIHINGISKANIIDCANNSSINFISNNKSILIFKKSFFLMELLRSGPHPLDSNPSFIVDPLH